MNVAGAAALLLEGRALEGLPNLERLEADGGIDAAFAATHDEFLIPLLTPVPADEIWRGRLGLPLLDEVGLAEFESLAIDNDVPPRGTWLTVVDFGRGWLLFPDDADPTVRFTVLDPVSTGADEVLLARVILAVAGERVVPAQEPPPPCREVVKGTEGSGSAAAS